MKIVNKKRFIIACIVAGAAYVGFCLLAIRLFQAIDAVYADRLMEAYEELMGF